MRNAFAPIVRARPCPIFGRPVRLRGRPHRLQPDTSPHALRIPDCSGHPALRDSSGWLQVRLGCVRLSPSCPFRLLHTRLLSRPARNYPRFRIQRSSSERRGDFNPHDSRAAQRTLWASPTSLVRSSSASASGLPGAVLAKPRKGGPEISRFPCRRRLRMPVSPTTQGRPTSRDRDIGRIAFCRTESIGAPKLVFAARWLAYAIPCQRFASPLTGRRA